MNIEDGARVTAETSTCTAHPMPSEPYCGRPGRYLVSVQCTECEVRTEAVLCVECAAELRSYIDRGTPSSCGRCTSVGAGLVQVERLQTLACMPATR